MNSPLSRRKLLKTVGAAALLASATGAAGLKPLPPQGGALPNIALQIEGGLGAGSLDDAGMRRIKQLGVNHVFMVGPQIPWQESQIRALVDKIRVGGLTLGNLMVTGFPNTLYGRPGRDAEIAKVRQSIRAAGAAGVPVVEYNFYAHRLVEGYYAQARPGGRGNDRIRLRPG